MNSLVKNLKERWFFTRYTIEHRKAFRKTEKELRGHTTLRGWTHDLDKVFMYLILGVDTCKKLHKKFARHHNPKTLKDYEESTIDWECARLSKPDKPLNAYETLMEYYKEEIHIRKPILEKWGLWNSGKANTCSFDEMKTLLKMQGLHEDLVGGKLQ